MTGLVRGRRWWLVAMVGALVLALGLGWWSKARCLGDGRWTDGEQYHQYCYSDVVALWYQRGLHEGAVPYLDTPVEYPVLQGGVMWATAALTRAGPEPVTAADYLDVNAALVAVLVLVAVVLVHRIGVVLPAAAWWAALPVVGLTTFINWDAVPVVLLAGAILAHQHDRDGAAGVLVGLGTAAKLYPVFLAPLVVIARLREGRRDAVVRHVAAAAGTWLALNVPVAVAAPANWNRFVELNRERQAHVDSLWFALDWLGGPHLSGTALNAAASGLFVAGAVAMVAVALHRRPSPPPWTLVAPVVVWFVVTNKVYSPQYSLWLVALLAVTLRRAAPFVAFAAADVAVHLTEFAVLGGRAGFPPAPGEGWLVLATVTRAAALGWVLATLLRSPVDAAPPARHRMVGPSAASRPEGAPGRDGGGRSGEIAPIRALDPRAAHR